LVAQAFDVGVPALEKEFAKRADERSFYTIDVVDDVLDLVAGSRENHPVLRNAFARMMAFDALLGAMDRHAQNWGIIEDVAQRAPPRFAPIFDTARGLFLHHPDSGLPDDRRDVPAFIEGFAARSKPLIGTGRDPECNHFALIEFMVRHHPTKYRRPVQQILDAFRPERVSRLLGGFHPLLTKRRLDLIDALFRYRHLVLRRILAGTSGEKACRGIPWKELLRS